MGLVRSFFCHTFRDMAKKAIGRPHLPKGTAKDVIVQTRVSEAERELLQQAADASGQKLSRWMRDRLLDAAKVQEDT